MCKADVTTLHSLRITWAILINIPEEKDTLRDLLHKKSLHDIDAIPFNERDDETIPTRTPMINTGMMRTTKMTTCIANGHLEMWF